MHKAIETIAVIKVGFLGKIVARTSIILILASTFIVSCRTYSCADFAGQTYTVDRSELGMFGEIKLVFVNDSLVFNSFNGGAIVSVGAYQIIDQKIIIDYYSENAANQILDLDSNAFYNHHKKNNILIKKNNKLILNNVTYRKITSHP